MDLDFSRVQIEIRQKRIPQKGSRCPLNRIISTSIESIDFILMNFSKVGFFNLVNSLYLISIVLLQN